MAGSTLFGPLLWSGDREEGEPAIKVRITLDRLTHFPNGRGVQLRPFRCCLCDWGGGEVLMGNCIDCGQGGGTGNTLQSLSGVVFHLALKDGVHRGRGEELVSSTGIHDEGR